MQPPVIAQSTVFLLPEWGSRLEVLPPPPHSDVHAGLLCVTVLNSASGLGSSEASGEEPMYDVIGELPLAALYEEIGEAEGEPQGAEDQGVARCNGRCVCSSGGEPGGGLWRTSKRELLTTGPLGCEESVGYGDGRRKPMRVSPVVAARVQSERACLRWGRPGGRVSRWQLGGVGTSYASAALQLMQPQCPHLEGLMMEPPMLLGRGD